MVDTETRLTKPIKKTQIRKYFNYLYIPEYQNWSLLDFQLKIPVVLANTLP